jgi:putative phosphoesterase
VGRLAVSQQVAVNAVVLADTHLRASGAGEPARWLPHRVVARLAAADVVLHAGDLLDVGVLERIRQQAGGAPVHAVLGNNDTGLEAVLPRTLVVELAGVRVGMVHDSGRRAGREARMRRWFPDCDVVVFGHSHDPVAATGAGGQLLFNPGSPTQRRRQPVATFGVLTFEGGRVATHQIVPV